MHSSIAQNSQNERPDPWPRKTPGPAMGDLIPAPVCAANRRAQCIGMARQQIGASIQQVDGKAIGPTGYPITAIVRIPPTYPNVPETASVGRADAV